MEGRPIARKTYQEFAKKYGINLTKPHKTYRKYKTFKELQQEIYDYENNNNINDGLYFYTSWSIPKNSYQTKK
jgi:hypothetical protein